MKFSTTTSLILAGASTLSAYPTKRTTSKITDIDILQYALTLEHLEDQFYQEGLAKFTLEHFEEAGFNETFYKNIKEVSFDETTHVSFLSEALTSLNATPVAACTYDFGVTDVASFIATASVLEGVGVSAYLGAAASIMDKTYLTAAGSILTVESRHSAYIRGAQKQSPFPQPFDAPLDFNQVYTLAAPFIKSCPESNGMLPVKAFPGLMLDADSTAVMTNATIMLDIDEAAETHGEHENLYAAWISVTGPTFTPAVLKEGNKVETMVPAGFYGQSYVVITKGEQMVSDDCVIAGPAIVEIMGAAGEA